VIFTLTKLSTCFKSETELVKAISRHSSVELGQGEYLLNFNNKGKTPAEYLRDGKHRDVGVTVAVENYSGLELVHPETHLKWGIWQRDDLYGKHHDVGVSEAEVFIFHNKGYNYRSSGSMSWLVVKPASGQGLDVPYWDIENTRKAYRLHLLWDIPTFHCVDSTVNSVKVQFQPHTLAMDNQWKEKAQAGYYDLLSKSKTRDKSFHSKKDLMARATITRGCFANVTLQFAASYRRHESPKITNILTSFFDGANPMHEDFSFTTVVLLGLGFLGMVVLLACIFKVLAACCKKKDNTEFSDVKYHPAKSMDDKTDEESNDQEPNTWKKLHSSFSPNQ